MNTSFRRGFLSACAENGMGASDIIQTIEKRAHEKQAILQSLIGSLTAMGVANGAKPVAKSVGGGLRLGADILTTGVPVGGGILAGLGGAKLLSDFKNRSKEREANELIDNYKNEILLDELRHQNLVLGRKADAESDT